jgi:hypothetical protein
MAKDPKVGTGKKPKGSKVAGKTKQASIAKKAKETLRKKHGNKKKSTKS